jgi:hypothetical protein
MPIEIVPFQDDLMTEAAKLLAERHARDHKVLPDLPPRFEDPIGAPGHRGHAEAAARERRHCD